MNSEIVSIDWKFRHIRFVNSFGKFTKVQKKLKNYEEVIEFLNRKNYLDAYYSVASFVNPHRIGSRTEENERKDLFLSMDLFFDVDFDEFSFQENIERARIEALKIIEFGEKKGWELRYISFSGSKGFHICYFDPFSYSQEKPFLRETEAMEKRKSIVSEMSESIKFDTKITVDSRRIVRIPGTYNSKTGYLCTLLSKSDLEKPAKVILKHIQKNKYWELRSRLISAMTVLRHYQIIMLPGLLPKPTNNISFLACVTSNAKKNHVIVLELSKRNNAAKIFESMKLPFVIYATPLHKKYIFSPVIVEFELVKKIARKIHSPSISTLDKYKHTVLSFQFLDKNMRVVGLPKILKSNIFQTNLPISLNHAAIFKEFSECKAESKEIDLNFVLLEHKK